MANWRDSILKHFQPKISRLTLVADPDGLLTEEHVPQDVYDDDNGLFAAEQEEPTQVIPPPGALPVSRSAPAPAGSTPRVTPVVPNFEAGRYGIDSEEERQRVLSALEQCAGNQTRAAKVLGVSRRTLINRLERLNMPRPKKV